jgi:hypothetical protein
MMAGELNNDVRAAIESAGGTVAQVEYELFTDSALAAFPDGLPAWAWCLHTERGRDFISNVEAVVGNDPTLELIDDNEAAQRRSWLLSSDVGRAVLIEETWTDDEGRWHASFKLRSQ